MGIVVLKRRFESAPNKGEIINLLVGDNVGNKDNAKAALEGILSPMKDLLALYQYVENMEDTAAQYADMLKEQEAVKASIDSLKSSTVNAKKAYDAAQAKVVSVNADIANLEQQKSDLAQEVEDAGVAKLRANKAVSDEYDRLRAEMLAKVAREEQEAQTQLTQIKTRILAAQAELDNLAEAKREFLKKFQ
jgi:chromosome segregation ATPase